jgi:hypothetical protein
MKKGVIGFVFIPLTILLHQVLMIERLSFGNIQIKLPGNIQPFLGIKIMYLVYYLTKYLRI